jgi:hypothetical protein
MSLKEFFSNGISYSENTVASWISWMLIVLGPIFICSKCDSIVLGVILSILFVFIIFVLGCVYTIHKSK